MDTYGTAPPRDCCGWSWASVRNRQRNVTRRYLLLALDESGTGGGDAGRRVHLVRAHCGLGGGVGRDHRDVAALCTQSLDLALQVHAPFGWSAQALELAFGHCPTPSAERREHHDIRVARGKVGVFGGAHAAVDVVRPVDADGGGRTRQCSACGDRVHQIDARISVESNQRAGMRVDGHHDHRPFRPFVARQPGGDHGAVLSRRRSEYGVALQPECAHRTLEIGRRGGGGGDGPHPLEHRGHRQGRRTLADLSDRLHRPRQHRGEHFGRWYAAAQLCCRGGTGRRADHHIGGLCHIETRFGEACDDADLPGISGSATTTENQSNVMSHLRVRRTSRRVRREGLSLAPSRWERVLKLRHVLVPFRASEMRAPEDRRRRSSSGSGVKGCVPDSERNESEPPPWIVRRDSAPVRTEARQYASRNLVANQATVFPMCRNATPCAQHTEAPGAQGLSWAYCVRWR